MTEPTYRQHKILEYVKDNGNRIHIGEGDEYENHWELVRGGYLKNMVVMSGGWQLILTDKSEEYFKSISDGAM